MPVAISLFEVLNDLENEVKEAFRKPPKMVENFEGFIRLDVISAAPGRLQTCCKNEVIFKCRHKNNLTKSHQGIAK